MTKPEAILAIDFETASHADIKVGSAAYAEHETTRVLCASFIFQRRGGGWEEWTWEAGDELPPAVVDWIRQGHPVLAHNVAFEHEIIKAGLVPGLPRPAVSQWHDTMAMAASLNLPQSLEGLTLALGVTQEKDTEGHALMMKLCKLNADGEHLNEPGGEDLNRLVLYCAQDVRATLDAYNAMPGMTQSERQTWISDTLMADRGAEIDVEFVNCASELTTLEGRRLRGESMDVTGGDVVDPVVEAKRYCSDRDIPLPRRKRSDGRWTESLDSAACEELLENTADMPSDVVAVLQRKVALGRLTSLSKLKAVGRMLSRDGRARWQLRFCGASQTGRWAAKGLQLHNIPKDRRTRAHSALVRDLVMNGKLAPLLACEPNVLEALSLTLRSMVVAPAGKDLIGADYSAIEARVLPWLAFDSETTGFFAETDRKMAEWDAAGRPKGKKPVDIYVKDAADQGSTDRDFGKVLRLGLGFQMGPLRFMESAAERGIELSRKGARTAVQTWRDSNPKIVEFWREIEDVARDLIQGDPGRTAPVGRCTLRRTVDRFLIELPSGRRLSYWFPRIVPKVKQFPFITKDGDIDTAEMEVDAIQFFGPKGKKMVVKETYSGKLTENVTQAAARDLLAHALNVVELHPTYTPVLHMHDALCTEVASGAGDPEEFASLISSAPDWARDLPVAAEGYRSPVFLG